MEIQASDAMAPAIIKGDHLFAERFTFFSRKPSRGDIVVFATDGIMGLPQYTFYVKRVAGLPGERLRIADGKIYVNAMPVFLTNAAGIIQHVITRGSIFPSSTNEELLIPAGSFYVLGDNSTNSLDSRSFGFVPAGNIRERAVFCYKPANRVGRIR